MASSFVQAQIDAAQGKTKAASRPAHAPSRARGCKVGEAPASPACVEPGASSGPAVGKQRPRHLESELQRQCVRWFAYQYPQYAGLLWATPNGGQRNAREAALLKAEGVRAGVPDLQLAVVTNSAPGLYLELKVGKNKPSPAQAEMLARLRAQGYATAVVYSLEAFTAAIKTHLGH